MSDKNIMEDLVKEKQALAAALEDMDSQLNKYKEIGTPEDIEKAMAMAKTVAGLVEGITLATVKDDIKQLAEYRKIGTIEKINEAVDLSTEFIETYSLLGKPEEIDALLKKSNSIIEEYVSLGTPTDISAMLDKYQENITSSRCEEIGAAFNVDSSLVRKMFDKANCFDTVKELLELSFNRKSSTSKKEVEEEKKPELKKTEKLTVESKKHGTASNLTSLLKSIM